MAVKKILIVDDEVGITKLLKIALERTGRYNVFCENKGSKALSVIQSFLPDLILLDVNMPDTSGGEILAAIHKHPEMKKIPVIFLTGMISDDEVQSGLTITGHPVMAKPINIEKLIGCIEENLGPSARV